MNWKNYIFIGISLVIGFFLGFIVRSYPTFEGILNFVETIRNFVIGGLSFAVGVEILGLLSTWYKEKRRDEREIISKKEKDRLDHAKMLLGALNYIAQTDIGFGDSDSKPNLRIQLKNEPPTIDYKMYSEDVDAHLKSGYNEVWGLIEKRELDITKYNIDLQKFLDDLRLDIVKQLKQKIPDIIERADSVLLTPTKYYTDGLFEVGWQIQYHYKPRNRFQLRKTNVLIDEKQKITIYKLLLNSTVLVASDNEKEIDDVGKMILKAFDDAIDSERFQILKQSFEGIEKKHYDIIKEIRTIIKDVENSTHLNGKCKIKICKNS